MTLANDERSQQQGDEDEQVPVEDLLAVGCHCCRACNSACLRALRFKNGRANSLVGYSRRSALPGFTTPSWSQYRSEYS